MGLDDTDHVGAPRPRWRCVGKRVDRRGEEQKITTELPGREVRRQADVVGGDLDHGRKVVLLQVCQRTALASEDLQRPGEGQLFAVRRFSVVVDKGDEDSAYVDGGRLLTCRPTAGRVGVEDGKQCHVFAALLQFGRHGMGGKSPEGRTDQAVGPATWIFCTSSA